MDNNSPLLSIVAPIRNESSYILELINSFSKINDSRVELLISDNWSNDGSYEIIINNSFANIKVVRPESRLSPFDNHIFAINQSSGRYIFPVGGDDYISPECIKLILEELRTGVIIVPKLRSFDDKSRKTIEITNLEKDVLRFYDKDKFSVRRYLKFINYDQLIFIVCDRKMLSHLIYIKLNTLETFASWSNIFVFSGVKLRDIVFIDFVLMNKRYNKQYLSSTFANEQYTKSSIFVKSINSIYNTFLFLKKTRDSMQTFYLLFFNRYAEGYYSKNMPTHKVRRLLTFSPIFMIILSPFLIIKNIIKFINKNLINLN